MRHTMKFASTQSTWKVAAVSLTLPCTATVATAAGPAMCGFVASMLLMLRVYHTSGELSTAPTRHGASFSKTGRSSQVPGANVNWPARRRGGGKGRERTTTGLLRAA